MVRGTSGPSLFKRTPRGVLTEQAQWHGKNLRFLSTPPSLPVATEIPQILVSTIVPDTHEEKAIFGGGFRNGLIVMARRLLAQGLLPKRDPHAE